MSHKVLVVDDSPVIRSVVQIYLKDHGCQILEAETAERALQVLRLVRVDLVIADVKMPGVGGLGLIRGLRQDTSSPSREAPVVLITAEKSPTIAQEGVAAGAAAVLRKPVTSASLIEAIQGILGKPKAAPAAARPATDRLDRPGGSTPVPAPWPAADRLGPTANGAERPQAVPTPRPATDRLGVAPANGAAPAPRPATRA